MIANIAYNDHRQRRGSAAADNYAQLRANADRANYASDTNIQYALVENGKQRIRKLGPDFSRTTSANTARGRWPQSSSPSHNADSEIELSLDV